MDEQQLNDIKARVAGIMPGKWNVPTRREQPFVVSNFNGGQIAVGWIGTLSDADFIAHAPDDIRALLAEVERLQAENTRLQAELDNPDRIVLPKSAHGLVSGGEFHSFAAYHDVDEFYQDEPDQPDENAHLDWQPISRIPVAITISGVCPKCGSKTSIVKKSGEPTTMGKPTWDAVNCPMHGDVYMLNWRLE